MDLRLVQFYKDMMGSLLKATTEKELPGLLDRLAALQDDTAEVRKEFDLHRSTIGPPLHWISLLRVIRMSFVLKNEILKNYDDFMGSYQKLTSLEKPGNDEMRLIHEMGNFLYQADELMGDHDRLTLKLIYTMHQGMLDDYGVNMEPDGEFYRSRINQETYRKVSPFVRDLFELCDRLEKVLQLMKALERMRKLIIKR